MRVAIYARYSSDQQNERSIADQIALAREYAEREGWIVVQEFSDAEISGEAIANRPGLQGLLRAAEAHGFEAVLTESLDRLTRGFADGPAIFVDLTYWGVKIVTLADGEMDKVRVAVKALVGSLQLDDLRQKTRRGQIGRVKAGRIPGGKSYGYDVVRDDEDRGQRKKNEVEAEVVRRIFEQYRAGVTPIAIVQALNAEGIPSPRRGPWNTSTLVGWQKRRNGILNNELYAGRIVYNRQRFVKNPRTGKRESRPNPPELWIIKEVPDLAIVDAETWQAVQNLRASRTVPHPRHHRRPKHLLSGLLTCGLCGGSMISHGAVRRTKEYPEGITYFRCSTYMNRRGCENKRTVPAPEIERRVLEGLQRKLLSPDAIELAIRTFREEKARLAAERARMRDSTVRELLEVRRQIANTARDISEHGGSRALSRALRDLEAREAALEAKLPKTVPDIVVLHPQAERRYRAIVEDLAKALAAPDDPRKARAVALLRSLITSIQVIPTPPRMPVGLEVTGNLLALIDETGALRRDAASQAASVAITA